MKHFLFFVLVLFFTLSVCAQEKWREVDLRVNGIGSGTSYLTILRKFGKPLRSEKERFTADNACNGSAETHLTLYYSGLEITLLGDGKGRNLEVYSIEVTSKNWVASGIKLGADIKDVRVKFGKTDEQADEFNQTVLHYVTKGNLGVVNFHFQNNKLVKMGMTETLC